MYGAIEEPLGSGPRYCPSIEDKIVRFKDKERHQLFIEPESIHYNEMYLQGFSTSMPKDIQEQYPEEVMEAVKNMPSAMRFMGKKIQEQNEKHRPKKRTLSFNIHLYFLFSYVF